MAEKPASMTMAEFKVLIRRAGLPLTPAQAVVLYEVFGHFEAMTARLRRTAGAPRPRSAEPSHIFVPGQGWGPR